MKNIFERTKKNNIYYTMTDIFFNTKQKTSQTPTAVALYQPL